MSSIAQTVNGSLVGAPCRRTLGASSELLNDRSNAQRSKAGTNFLGEQLRLFPRREVPTLVDLVVINEVSVRPFRPAEGRAVDLVGKDAHRNGDADVGGIKKRQLVFPIETGR